MTAPVVVSVEDLHRQSPPTTVMPMAVVALGANLPGAHGQPADALLAVIPALQLLSDFPVVASRIIETDPEDCPPGSPRFANAVVVLVPLPDVDAVSFLMALQKLEADFGRQRKGVKNEARVIDLDLISFGEQCVNTEFLVLPHPRARQRVFVLQPLAEVWPTFRFPGDSLTAIEHLLLLKQEK